MKDIRIYPAYPSDLDVLSSFMKLEEYLRRCNFEEDESANCPRIQYTLEVSSTRTLIAHSFHEFIDLLRQFQQSLPINIHGHFFNKKKEHVTIIVSLLKSALIVTIESNDLNIISAFHEKAKGFFQASNPLENEEKPVSRYGLKKTIFLAHRFDEAGNEICSRLNTFLKRLGFDVKEGAGYEARNIPEKVTRKIKEQDIFICLVTPGDSSWILSEASTAKALNKYMIIVSQMGIEFSKGILGQDYEYLEFPDENIEKIYSKLLYALPS